MSMSRWGCSDNEEHEAKDSQSHVEAHCASAQAHNKGRNKPKCSTKGSNAANHHVLQHIRAERAKGACSDASTRKQHSDMHLERVRA